MTKRLHCNRLASGRQTFGVAIDVPAQNRLGRYGVQVLCLQEPWTEAVGELRDLLLAIAGWVAKMESTRRSERTKAGLARAIAQGKRLGRPPGSKDKR